MMRCLRIRLDKRKNNWRRKASPRSHALLAIKRKDIRGFRSLVNIFGLYKLSKGDDGISLLRIAISRNASNIAKFLITHGVDVNQIKFNSYFPSLLHLTVAKNNQEILCALLNKGINLNTVGLHSRSPLEVALRFGHVKLAQQLIENGANVNEKFQSSLTPLHLACMCGDKEFVKFLLENKCDINHPCDLSNITPVIVAISHNHVGIVELLLNGGACLRNISKFSQKLTLDYVESDVLYLIFDINGGKGKRTKLNLGGYCSNVLLLLVEKGANVSKHFLCQLVRYEATSSNSYNVLDMIEPLLNAGADLYYVDEKGKNVLYYATEIGNCTLVKKILDLGLSVESCYKKGIDLIHIFASGCDLETFEVLLKACPDLNVKDKYGQSILYKAVEAFRPDIVKLVLKFIKKVDKDCGEKCLNFLLQHMKENLHYRRLYVNAFCRIVRQLLNCGAKLSKSAINSSNFILAVESCSYELVETFLDAGMNPDAVSTDIFACVTPLEVACRQNSADIAELLLKRGADTDNLAALGSALRVSNLRIIRAFVEKGIFMGMEALLYWAVNISARNVVEYLLGLGLKYNLRKKRYLISSVINSNDGILSLMINHGAPLDAQDSVGNTALHIASGSYKKDCVETLLKSGANVNIRNSSGETVVQYALHTNSTRLLPDILMRHVILLKLTKQQVEEKDFVFCSYCLKDNKFMICCKEELEDMKTMNICNSRITYYDFAIANVLQAARYLQNAEILNLLSTLDFNEMFPFCGYLMVLKFKQASEIILLHNKGVEKLQDIFQESGIPLEIIHRICWNLREEDLQLFCGISP